MATYDYVDETGKLLYQVVRLDPKNFRQRRPDGKGGYVWNLKGTRRVLYRLPELLKAPADSLVFACEGEKAADSARSIGLTATTSVGGANAPGRTDWQPLAGREVIILPDNDRAGRDYADRVARILTQLSPVSNVKIVQLPGLPEHGDIVEFIAAHASQNVEALRKMVEATAANAPQWTAVAPAVGEPDRTPPKKSQGTTLTELVKSAAGLTLWHTPDRDGYATIQVGNHFENWPIRSRDFRQWACALYLDAYGRVPGGQAVQDAINTLEGTAVSKGAEHRIYVRLAEHQGAIYLDLGNAEWEAVEVKAGGWARTHDAPVKFRRARGMLPLSVPTTGGDLRDLRQFVNVHDDAVFVLIVGWLIGTLHPHGPYPVLEVDGEHGSAKTTLCRMLRRLVDPNKADLRTQPRDERDLVIAARNAHILGFDNLSGVRPWLSDGLSRIATGAGFSTRELYSDAEEVIFSGARPVVCNGISGVATRPDLLDRTIRVDLPAISENQRKPEADLWLDFDAARPGLLGAILDAVATALNRLPSVKLDRLPRMADFARWVVAAEPSLPWERGAFMAAYAGNREAANESALEASPVAGVLRTWFDRQHRTTWTGTATELLSELAKVATDAIKAQKYWPKSGRGLSGALRRVAPNLRAVEIDVLFDTEGRGNDKRRIITVREFGNDIDPTDPIDPDPPGDPGNPDSRGRSPSDGDATAPPRPSPDTPLFGSDDADGNDGDGGAVYSHNCSDEDGSDREKPRSGSDGDFGGGEL